MFPGARIDSRLYLDRYGMALSVACALHCALLPLGMTFLVGAGLSWLASRELEWAILGSTFLLGSTRLLRSFLRHRNPAALGLFCAGLASFAAAKSGWVTAAYAEAWFMVLGGIFVAAAHLRNLRLCTCCAHRH